MKRSHKVISKMDITTWEYKGYCYSIHFNGMIYACGNSYKTEAEVEEAAEEAYQNLLKNFNLEVVE